MAAGVRLLEQGGGQAELRERARVEAAIPLIRAGKLDGVMLGVLALVVVSAFEAVASLPQAAQHLEGYLVGGQVLPELHFVPQQQQACEKAYNRMIFHGRLTIRNAVHSKREWHGVP